MENHEKPQFAPKDSRRDKAIIEGLIRDDVEKVGGDYVASFGAEEVEEMRKEAEEKKLIEEDKEKFGTGKVVDEFEEHEKRSTGEEWKGE